MKLLLFLLRRLGRLAVSLLIVSLMTFLLLSAAPGTFAGIQATGAAATGLASVQGRDVSSQVQQRFGADQPVWQQYGNWLGPALHGDLGYSYKYPGSTVSEIIGSRLPVSATLGLLAMALALLISVPLGVLAAVRRNSGWDYGSMFAVTLGTALPSYLAAIMLVLVFASRFHLLATGGWTGPKDVVLPVLALALAPIGMLARYVRSSVLEVLREEYVVAATAKGGPRRLVLRRHILRNSLMPLVTVAGPQLASMVVGTIFIEIIFSIPGIGSAFVQSALVRDMPLLMGTTLTFALILMLMNLLVDLSYAVLDPRVRSSLGLSSDIARSTHADLSAQMLAPISATDEGEVRD